MTQHLRIAILPIPLGIDIRSLSSVKTVEQERSSEDEDAELAATLEPAKAEARWIFESRLAVRHLFQFVPSERTDAALELIGMRPGEAPTADQSLSSEANWERIWLLGPPLRIMERSAGNGCWPACWRI
ncbi:hypothetical protein [Nitrospira moscoviensis]|uniref:Uncharacterized protein n=1 Tax=Nitrospira moscoviensis TaxID=42253 RepID=A0A0K2G8X0_NITMO|nr:hypothetical protein [Nitrospira moscoviensis]ALA57314.1 hypothetical protein NITMOv2_0879 [Nitrospira moscoviensis]